MICGAPLLSEAAYAEDVHRRARGLPIEFTGWRDDVAAVFAELDFLVVPSTSDATTRVILEAFSAGVPVIAARVGGIPEVVRRPETGFLYEGSAPEAIAGAIRAALAMKPEARARMRVQVREHWARSFTLDRYRGEMVALLEQAAQQKPRD